MVDGELNNRFQCSGMSLSGHGSYIGSSTSLSRILLYKTKNKPLWVHACACMRVSSRVARTLLLTRMHATLTEQENPLALMDTVWTTCHLLSANFPKQN